ncbi:FecCD family ABC transporter permease [Agarivorans sp. QJM3NY_25]|uniref:FecCD family ABC transporter permease n=1 Tax=Agarivorans sp. QJM3NY_25 TaxID=3421430 RepID=UPI003D7C771F
MYKFIWLVVLLLLLMLMSLFIGPREISYPVTLQAIFDFDSNNTLHLIVHYLRIPRTLLAVLVGAALGVSGVIIQGLTRNPLADPGILGINAGAMAMIVVAIAFFGVADVDRYLWFGFAGAGLTGLLVYLLAGRGNALDSVRFVLAGTALTIVLLGITNLITLNSHQEVFNQFRHWIVGSLQGRTYEVLKPVSLCVSLGLVLAYLLAKPLDSVVLGEQLGASLGVNTKLLWGAACVVIMILAGSATAAVGPISFLGLTAPHIAKLMIGTEHRKLLPFSMLVSAILLLGADILGRIIGHPNEISAGVMVALLGGPFFLLLVRR